MRSCRVCLVRCFKEFISSKFFGRLGLGFKFLFLVRIPWALSRSLLLAELANIPSLSSREELVESLFWRIPVLPFRVISNVSCWFFSFKVFMPCRSERGVLGFLRVILYFSSLHLCRISKLLWWTGCWRKLKLSILFKIAHGAESSCPVFLCTCLFPASLKAITALKKARRTAHRKTATGSIPIIPEMNALLLLLKRATISGRI